MQDFVHLHVHSQYSLLDGQCAVNKIVDKAIADGMKGMALTDHGNMMGIKELWNYVTKINSGIDDPAKKFKPILGCEMYVAHNRLEDRDKSKGDMSGYHLIVLAKNSKGYHNLIKLVSKAWTEGYYMRPRTDRVELEKYHEGLIVSTACLAGEVPKKIINGDITGAEEAIQWYKSIFGDDYYLELMRHKATVAIANREAYELQCKVNPVLVELSKKYGVKLICTNDVHFVDEENAEAHDRLICLSTGKDLDDPTRMLYSKQEWFKTKAEMNEIFADIPEALSNTVEICDKVEFYSIDHAPIMPNFAIPVEFGTEDEYRTKFTEKDLFDEFTQDEHGKVVMDETSAKAKIKKLGGYDKLYRIKLEADYLQKLTFDGAKTVYGDPLSDEIKERLIFELHVMKTMGFPGYFLIVQDFINAASKELNVSVGPGRGSAAGSAVAYCLGITKIDPIKYDLLFERFLNPDRISLPDIDVDFDDDGRGEVLRWVTQKYGQEKVAHIITYGTMATKMVIKDVARVEKLPLSESDRLVKYIPDKLPEVNGKVPKMNLKNCIAAIPELQDACNSENPLIRDTMKYAQMLEGNVRGTGVHACGTIICRDDITDWVPVSTAVDKDTNERLLVTQYEGRVIEDTGLIKMDFLGLKTLSIIKEAVAIIKDHTGKDIDIDHIDINDPATYKLYCDGRTIGTFQFESAGMQKYLRELQPSTFEDLIAMNALYRPGPMAYIPSFINRKHGREPITYDIPCMEKYLKDTYGITVYQEQVMLLSRLLANFTRGESDALRKAMGKKLKEKLDHMKPKFIEGGKKNGHDPKILEKIWSDWESFASYAFNKSHATCYSWVAYQTAYLKANYPAEYMAAVMSRSLANITDITKLMDECKAMGMSTLGPSVNESKLKFTVTVKGDIRFGLGAIKGVGENAVASIVEEREKNGPYKNIFDFVQRVNLSSCNRKNIECLAQAGAFDCFSEIKREQFFVKNVNNESYSDILVRYGNKVQADKATATNSLFGDTDMIEVATPPIPEYVPWSDVERLNKEKDLVGIYISAHPLDEFSVILNDVCNTKVTDLSDVDCLKGKDLTFGGIVTNIRKGTTKKGNPYAIMKLEDYSGSGDIAFFGNDYITWGRFLEQGLFLYIKAICQPKKWRQDEYEVHINSMQLLSDVKDNLIEKLTIIVPLSALSGQFVADFQEVTAGSPGQVDLRFCIYDDEEVEQHQLIEMQSRTKKITVGKKVISFLKEHPEFRYQIN